MSQVRLDLRKQGQNRNLSPDVVSQFNIQGKNIQLKLGSACETSSNNIALSPDFNREL
jgi:hypothetical protein